MNTTDLRKFLLAGTAIVAVGAFASGAQAADAELAAAEATPTNLNATLAADTDDITNTTDDANDFGAVDVNGGETVTNIDSDYDGGLAVYDGTGADDTLTVSGYVDVASGTTLELFVGGSEVDGSGTNGAVDINITGTLGQDGGSTLTRGGTLDIQSVAEDDDASTVDIAGSTLMTNIDVTGAAGGTADGADVTVTFGDSSSDTFNVTTLDVTAGAGSASADGENGGDVTVNVNGAATIGGAITVTGGADAAGAGGGATGGNAALDFNNDVTSTSTLAVSGGVVAAAGTNGNALVTFGGDATFTAITLEEGAADGTATLTFDGSSVQTVTGTIDGATATEGVITITGAGVTFEDAIGATTDIESITLSNDGTGSTVTFMEEVGLTAAPGLVLGDGGGTEDTYTAVFDSSDENIVIDAVIDGVAGEISNLTFQGGGTVTQSATFDFGDTESINGITITGNTTFVSEDVITLDATEGTGTITIASGSTLQQGADLITAVTIANSGTINQTGTGGITANITGTGALDIDESATYTGNVTAASANIANTKELTVVGAYDVDTTTLVDSGQLDITAGNNITGNIVADADTDGTLTITNGGGATTAISGNIGTSSAAIGNMTFAASADADTVSTTGNLYVDAISLGQADTLSFLATSGTQVVHGTVDASSETGAGLNIGDATNAVTVQFDGIVGGSDNIDNLTVNDNATAIFNSDATFDGALSADAATIEVGNGDTLTAATQTDADVTTWNINVNKVGDGAQTNGTVVLTGDAVNLAVDTVHFELQSGSAPLTTGASVLNDVFQGSAPATIAGATVTDNSYIYGFTLVADTNNVDVTVTEENSIDDTVSSGLAATGNQLLTSLATSTNTEINLLQSEIAAQSTASAVEDVVEAAASDVSGGAVVAGLSVANQTGSITGTRLAALRSGHVTSMAAGDLSDGVKVWG